MDITLGRSKIQRDFKRFIISKILQRSIDHGKPESDSDSDSRPWSTIVHYGWTSDFRLFQPSD